MRFPILCAIVLAALAGAAKAEGVSWPIVPTVTYPAAGSVGPDGGTATLRVELDDGAEDVSIDVYGLDGMRAGDANLIHIGRARMAAGDTVAIDVPFHPGPGRSMLVVAMKARFTHAGFGSAVRSFPFGEESATQRAGHTDCVRQDPDGTWIRVMDCAAAASAAPPTLDVTDLAAAAAGEVVRMTGYVVDRYLCPPCPPGAECKPCAIGSAIFVASSPGHTPVNLADPPADVAVVAARDPLGFETGVLYRFELTVARRSDGGFDGRLLRSQRPDREPIWTDAPTAQ